MIHPPSSDISDLFWLTDAQVARFEPYFPKFHGKPRVDDRRVWSGIIFINRNCLRWRDAPKEYGPHKMLYNRWKRWNEKGVFALTMAGLAAKHREEKTVMVDATYLKAQRTATSMGVKKGGRGRLACGEVSLLAWDVLEPLAFAVMSVGDADAVAVMRTLANANAGDPPIAAGESAVAGLAAFLAASGNAAARKALEIDGTSRILCFGTEGDTDPALYREIVGRSADEVRSAA